MIELGKIIYKILNDAKIKAYPIVAPEETTLPFVVYERSFSQTITNDGRAVGMNNVNIYILSEDYKESITITSQVDALMINLKGDYSRTRIQICKLVNCDEVYESGIFIQKLTYEIRTT